MPRFLEALGEGLGSGLERGMEFGIEHAMLRKRRRDEEEREDAQKLKDYRIKMQGEGYKRRQYEPLQAERGDPADRTVDLGSGETWEYREPPKTPEEIELAELETRGLKADIAKKEATSKKEVTSQTIDWGKEKDRIEKKYTNKFGEFSPEKMTERDKLHYDFIMDGYEKYLGYEAPPVKDNTFDEDILDTENLGGIQVGAEAGIPPNMAEAIPEKELTDEQALEYLEKAGGDKDLARELAKKDGYIIK